MLHQAFEDADTDDDGHLSLQEFMQSIRQVCEVHLSDNELKKLFVESDTNNSGTISYTEFAFKFGKGTFLMPEFTKKRCASIDE